MRLLTLASLLAALVATPAVAWDYSEYWDEMEVWISTYQNDTVGGFQLALTCSDLFPDDSDISIYTPEAWEATSSYAPEVPLTITVDGVATGPLSAKFDQNNGKLMVIARETEDNRVRPLFDLLRQAKTGIEVAYFDKTLKFDVGGADYMIGKFLTSCNGESVF